MGWGITLRGRMLIVAVFFTTDSVERVSPDEIEFHPFAPHPSLEFIGEKK